MSMHTPQGPQRGGTSVGDIVALVSALWLFATRTWIGVIVALALIAYLLFNLALYAVPRVTLMMAQKNGGEEEGEEKREGKEACYAIVVETKDMCLGDAGLPAPGGDLAGMSMADATPAAILLPQGDGYFPSVFDLTIKLWQAAVDQAPEPNKSNRRRCIAQIITDHFGERNTFASFSGDATERNAIAGDIGWFSWPVVRLQAPDYNVRLHGLTFAPLAPDRVRQTCSE